MYVAPYSVSGRVVNTRISRPATGAALWKTTSAPSLRPIQLRCMATVEAGQSSSSRSASRRSAYLVMRSSHWRRSLRTTGLPQRSHRPWLTSSLARPVLSTGHQLMGTTPS